MIALLACAPYTISLPGPPQAPDEPGVALAQLEPYQLELGGLWTVDGSFISDQAVTLHNRGEQPLQILGYAMDDATGTFSVSGPGQTVLEPGDATTLVVSFNPTDFEVREAVLKVATTDPGLESHALVRGLATGPQVSLKLEDCQTENVPVGCEGLCTLRVTNAGNASLRIDSLQLEGTGLSLAGQGGFSSMGGVLQSGPWSEVSELPWYIEPGETLPLLVKFTPVEAVQTTASIHMATNAALQPELVEMFALHSPGPNIQSETHLIDGGLLDILVVPRVDPDAVQGTVLQDAVEDFMAALPDLLDILDGVKADWRLSIQVSDDGCMAESPVWVDGATNRADALRTLSQQLSSGVPGVLSGAGFVRAERALLPQALGPGGCNQGWRRRSAGLAIVGISDMPESSGLTWHDHVAVLEQLAGGGAASNLSIHAFAGEVPGACSGVSPGLGWLEATTGTGGIFYSLCEDVHSGVLLLGETLVSNRETLAVAGNPIASTISIMVDGLPRESGWMYDASLKEIVFSGQAPVYGSSVVVTYEAEPVCAAP